MEVNIRIFNRNWSTQDNGAECFKDTEQWARDHIVLKPNEHLTTQATLTCGGAPYGEVVIYTYEPDYQI